MKNKDFIKEWCLHPSKEGHCGNLWACYNKLYSYSTCIYQYSEGIFYCNMTRYSPTTSRHRNLLIYYLNNYCKEIVTLDNIERNSSKLLKDY